MRRERPPRLATRLLSLALPHRSRDAIVGDLAEEWTRRVEAGGAGHLWYWRQVVALALGYRGRRLLDARGHLAQVADGLRHDVVGAVRRLTREPRFSLVALLLLASGIGLVTAVFSVVHAVLLAPLPYPAAERLVRLHETHFESGVLAGPVSPGNFLDWEAGASTLEAMAAAYSTEAALTDGDPVETIAVGEVTGAFFAVLRTPPLLGRTFDERDTGGAWLDNAGRFHGAARVVLGERLWRRRYLADPGIVGRTIGLNGQQAEVIGVMPATLRLPEPEVMAWVAWDIVAGYGAGGSEPPRNSRFVQVTARLADAARPEDARGELAGLAARLAASHPRTNAGWSTDVRPLASAIVGDAGRPLTLLAVAVGLLMLGVCASLAGMQVARGAGRASELAVRAALGAGRGRIVRQLLLENLVLALLGSLLGLGVGRLGLEVGLQALPADLPRPVEAALHWPVVAIAIAMGVLSGLGTGAVAALRGSPDQTAARLRGQRSAGAPKAGPMLVVAEVALAVVLVAATGLLARSFTRLLAEDPGFDRNGVLTARFNLEAGVSAQATTRVEFFARLLREIADDPQVHSVGGATFLPMTAVGPDFDRPYWRPGSVPPDGNAPRGWIRIVTPGFFESLRIRLRSGRAFDDGDRFDFADASQDRAAARVVIVNQTLAGSTWPDLDPIDRTLIMDYPGEVHEYRVVGVVEDVRPHRLGQSPLPEIYLPYRQIPYPGLTLAIRTLGDPAAFEPRLRAISGRLNPLQPVDRVVPLVQHVATTLQRERFVLGLVGAFGTAALLLAGLGIFGLVDLLVHRRTRELGIRMALGARPAAVRGLVLRAAARLTIAGLALGLGATALASRWLGSSLYRTSPLDSAAIGATLIVIGASALLAAWLLPRVGRRASNRPGRCARTDSP